MSCLNTNALAFIGLCNEYCMLAENASGMTRNEFIQSAVRILPRLYISASDLQDNDESGADTYIEPALDEDMYEQVRSSVASLMGAEDTYLEVFEEDMKYSDTPIAASVAEGIADIFQSCYNFVTMVRDAPEPLIADALEAMKEEFRNYWSQTLCNLLRPLNQLRYNSTDNE